MYTENQVREYAKKVLPFFATPAVIFEKIQLIDSGKSKYPINKNGCCIIKLQSCPDLAILLGGVNAFLSIVYTIILSKMQGFSEYHLTLWKVCIVASITGHFLKCRRFSQTCHARMLLSGIHWPLFSGFPLKTCGNDSLFYAKLESVR